VSKTKGKDNHSLSDEKPVSDKPETSSTFQLSGTDAQSVGNIEKIRDILIGAQIRDYEKKYAHLKYIMHKEVVYLRDEANIRLDSLEE
jgi:hypothetical protein